MIFIITFVFIMLILSIFIEIYIHGNDNILSKSIAELKYIWFCLTNKKISPPIICVLFGHKWKFREKCGDIITYRCDRQNCTNAKLISINELKNVYQER